MRKSKVLSVAVVFTIALLVIFGAITQSRAWEVTSTYHRTSLGTDIFVYNVLKSEASTVYGYWIDTHDHDVLSLHVYGISGETVQVRGSNYELANTDAGIQLGSDITADGITTITAVPFYTKVMISAGGSGTVSAYLMGKKQ